MTDAQAAMEKAKKAANGIQKFKAAETLAELLNQEGVKKRFADVLGKKAAGFTSSLLTLTTTQTNFAGVDPKSILSSAMIAATLDLPINQNLGFAHIVPYSGVAQFQMGWKGFVQLAIRTGQYKTINAAEVYEGELRSNNRFTGEVDLDPNGKISDKTIGFYAFFKLINGFEKSLYMTADEVAAHGRKFSKSFSNPNSRWQKDFSAMSLKTVVKLLLGKWGILSVDLQRAIMVDQGVIKGENLEAVEYPDAKEDAPVEAVAAVPIDARQVSVFEVQILQAKDIIGEALYMKIMREQFKTDKLSELNEGRKEMLLMALNAEVDRQNNTVI